MELQFFNLSSQHGRLHFDSIGHDFTNENEGITLPSTWGGSHCKEITLEAWIKPAERTGDFQAILSPTDTSFIHFQVHDEGVGNISIYTDQGPVILPVIPLNPLNVWRHVAVIAKSGDSHLLIDGQPYGETNTATFNYITGTDELFYGCGFQKGRYFNGQIGDIGIYYHARTQAEIHDSIYRHHTEKPEMIVREVPETTTELGLKGAHGTYISAQPDGSLTCDRSWRRAWEIFTVEEQDGKVGFKSAHGKYISAQPDGSITCDRDRLRGWELFTREEQNGRVGFKSAHGKYISAQPDGTITCDRDWLRSWELFTEE
ncbi:MAG: LamG-like jellyroll fold domain-containing protein [Bacteroidota bacterium]